MKDFRIKSPADAYKVLKSFGKKRQEHFIVLTLNSANEVIKKHVVTIGLLNKTMAHPREVFFHAIKDNALSIIIAHNHPSGHPEPGNEDASMTEAMEKAGEVLGIPVLDHIIVGKNRFYSFQEQRAF